jgi:hypothetical protein
MEQGSGGSDTLGTISFVSGLIGLFGQGCCCIPLINMIASMVIPICMMLAIILGIAGVASAAGAGRRAPLSWMGLVLGVFDVAFLCLWYGTLICGYMGLVVLSAMADNQ